MRNRILCGIAALLLCGTMMTLIPGTTSNAYASDEGMVLHLKFDQDATDSSGNSNNGTCLGNITYEDGVFGSAAVFDGESYIEVKDSDTLDLQTSFTISLWAYKEYNYAKFVPYVWKDKQNNTGFSPYMLYDHWLNCPNVFLHGKDLNQFSMSGTMLDICQWNLITITYDGSEVCMYQNGKLNIKKSATGIPNITNGNLNIGLYSDRKVYFNGKMDDLRIYSKTLTADEVKALYNSGYENNPTLLEKEEAIVAHYEFEGNYEDSSIFKNNGELLSESDSVAFVPAIAGQGIRLGEGSYIEVKDHESLNMEKEFTVSSWMKKDTDDTMPIIYRLNSSMNSNPNTLDYCLTARTSMIDFVYQPFISNTSSKSSRLISKSKYTGLWMHVALTCDGKELRWYVDGKLAKKEDAGKLEVANANGTLMIGTDGKIFFSGVLDELKLYNYALTADEVKEEYNRQDALSISKENQTKIKALKVKSTLALDVSRKYVATGESEKIRKNITYTSSNTKIFKVDKKGKITAVKKGSATLTITQGGISKSYKVTVK